MRATTRNSKLATRTCLTEAAPLEFEACDKRKKNLPPKFPNECGLRSKASNLQEIRKTHLEFLERGNAGKRYALVPDKKNGPLYLGGLFSINPQPNIFIGS